MENGKVVGNACAKAIYKGSSDVNVYYDGDYMFGGKFYGGIGNVRETFGFNYKNFGDVGLCFGKKAMGGRDGVCLIKDFGSHLDKYLIK